MQLVSALAMFGRLPFLAPHPPLGAVRPPLDRHGRVPRLAARRLPLPLVARLRDDAARGSSSTGSPAALFYGAFTTKLLALRSRRLPGWALPVIGGTLVAGLVVIWMTSALWFFTTVDFPGYH